MINNVEIERVYDNTFLGVIIYHKLCWNSHSNHVKTKMSKSIAILNRIKHILHEKTLYIYYIYIYIYAFSRYFYPKRFRLCIFFVSTYVPWESNPQPLRC